MAGPAPPRLRVATVWEDRQPYGSEIRVLFASLRAFGGSLSQAPCVAYSVGSSGGDTASFLAAHDVEVRPAERVHPEISHANVLNMLEEPAQYDWLVTLDPDVAVARDFSAFLEGSSLRARIAGSSPWTVEEWRQVFDLFGLELPAARHRAMAVREELVPYLNSGVLLIPARHVEPLRDAWGFYIDAIYRERDHLPAERPDRRMPVFTKNQLSLTLAVAKAAIPYNLLPLEMNLSWAAHPDFRPDELDPYLLHYLHRLDDDLWLHPYGFRAADSAISRINRTLDRPLGRSRFHLPYALRSKLRLLSRRLGRRPLSNDVRDSIRR